MAEKHFVVVVSSMDGKVVYSARFVTKKAASAAAEFWSLHIGGKAAVIEDWKHEL